MRPACRLVGMQACHLEECIRQRLAVHQGVGMAWSGRRRYTANTFLQVQQGTSLPSSDVLVVRTCVQGDLAQELLRR